MFMLWLKESPTQLRETFDISDGKIARRSGLGIKTIRFYEKLVR